MGHRAGHMKIKRPLNLWIDMDGVLCSFHRAAYAAWNVPLPVSTVLPWDCLLNHLGCSIDELFRKCNEDPQFWHNLDAYPWTPDMLQFLDKEFPNWRILSAGFFCPESIPGKIHWVRATLGTAMLKRLVLVGADKSHICAPGDFLVDDHHKTVHDWRAAGGNAFQWVEYTPDCPAGFGQLEVLKATLMDWKSDYSL
jgi:5'(3')-deoxyribonucleotidase